MFSGDSVMKSVQEIVQRNSYIDKIISTDDDLRKLGINSLNFIKMIVSIEDEFGIEFPDDALCFDKYNTVIEIADLVFALLEKKKTM